MPSLNPSPIDALVHSSKKESNFFNLISDVRYTLTSANDLKDQWVES